MARHTSEEAPTFFPQAADFRAWLEEHHTSVDHLWVGYYKKATGKPSVTWEDTVDEALCYGWIDGIRKSRDDESYVIRFTPRKPKSVWESAEYRSRGAADGGRLDEARGVGSLRPQRRPPRQRISSRRPYRRAHSRDDRALQGYPRRLGVLSRAATGVSASHGQMGHGREARGDTATSTLDADRRLRETDCGSSSFVRG